MKNIKATLTTKSYTGKIRENRKEDHFKMQYTLVNTELKDVVQVRIYRTKSRSYACIWVQDSKHSTHVSGGGYAGGYGYHKDSASVASAIENAGIKLDCDISGRGDSMIESAIKAIGKALGYRKFEVLTAHA